MSRGEFLDYFGEEYQSGQHVTMLGPTQRGKTTLGHQMLAQVITPEFPVYILALKPPHRDPVMAAAAKRLNLVEVCEYPSPMQQRIAKARKRNGFVVRPQHEMLDTKATNQNMRRVVHETLTKCYASRNPLIIDSDETHVVQNELGLKDDLEVTLMRGAPDIAGWNRIQRGYHITYHAYGAPEWVIVFRDPVRQNQQRYADIGGVDPGHVIRTSGGLRTKIVPTMDGRSKVTISEALCIRRSGPQLFIVGTE
jgi:hypothetical protein